jgi:hypothetical protein
MNTQSESRNVMSAMWWLLHVSEQLNSLQNAKVGFALLQSEFFPTGEWTA